MKRKDCLQSDKTNLSNKFLRKKISNSESGRFFPPKQSEWFKNPVFI